MIRWIPAAAIVAIVLGAQAAYAQAPTKDARSGRSSFPAGSIEGRVLDNSNRPVVGAMVSVVGRTTAAAATDRDGRYSLRELPYGPYILSVHSRGFFKSRGRTVQLTASTVSIPEIQLQAARPEKAPAASTEPVADASAVQVTQLAGFGLAASQLQPANVTDSTAVQSPSPQITDEETSEEGETAWRLRHLPRSILKDASPDAVWAANREDERWISRPSSAALMPNCVR